MQRLLFDFIKNGDKTFNSFPLIQCLFMFLTLSENSTAFKKHIFMDTHSKASWELQNILRFIGQLN